MQKNAGSRAECAAAFSSAVGQHGLNFRKYYKNQTDFSDCCISLTGKKAAVCPMLS